MIIYNHSMNEQLFHIGVKWLIKNSEWKYLCVKSAKWFYDIPWGRISKWEDWKCTLFRELYEELNITSISYTTSDNFIPLPTSKFTQKEPEPIKLFLLIYHCTLKEDVSIVLNEENISYSWETARDLYEKIDILHALPFNTIFD